MNSVLKYAKVPVTIQSYAKAQSYAKMTGKPSEPKDTRHSWHHAVVAVTVSYTSYEFPGLNINDDGTFTLYGKFYLLKAFILEDIYLGKLRKFFQDVRRDKKIDWSTKTDESSKNKNLQGNNCELKTLKVAATKTENKLEEVGDSKSVLSDHTFTFGAAPDRVQTQYMSDTKPIS